MLQRNVVRPVTKRRPLWYSEVKMTNEMSNSILEQASLWHWPCLYIDPTTTIGPGQEQWERDLPLLTPEQALTLENKISRQQARLATERNANVSPVAIQRAAKLSSQPAPRGTDRPAGSSTAARRSDGKR